jgi:hypothetical protein
MHFLPCHKYIEYVLIMVILETGGFYVFLFLTISQITTMCFDNIPSNKCLFYFPHDTTMYIVYIDFYSIPLHVLAVYK